MTFSEHGTHSGSHRLRASDSEREQIATILRAAMGEGRLNLADGEERITAAYAATYRDELDPLTADLPHRGRHALAETPEAKAYARRAIRRHGTFVFVVAVVLVGLWLASEASFFWPVIPLAFIAIGFAKHARYARYRWHGGWGNGPWGRGWR
jgi:hypothetical protein